jgi:predicted RNA-binding protein
MNIKNLLNKTNNRKWSEEIISKCIEEEEEEEEEYVDNLSG